MKAYVITSGTYSDYRIEAITLDKNIADALVKKTFDSRIEEFEVVDDKSVITETKDYVQIWDIYFAVNGNIIDIKSFGYSSNTDKIAHLHVSDREGEIIVSVYCNDKEKAIKIATDERSMYLAKKYGISL